MLRDDVARAIQSRILLTIEDDVRVLEMTTDELLLLADGAINVILAALEMPSGAMLDAVSDHDNYWGYRADGRPFGPGDAWQAMFTAFCKENLDVSR